MFALRWNIVSVTRHVYLVTRLIIITDARCINVLITEVPMAVNNHRSVKRFELRSSSLTIRDAERLRKRDARFVNHRVLVRSPAADATFMIYEHYHLIAASPSVSM